MVWKNFPAGIEGWVDLIVCVWVGLAGKWRSCYQRSGRLSRWPVHIGSCWTPDDQDGEDSVRLRQAASIPGDGPQSSALLLHARWPRPSLRTVQEVHSPRTYRWSRYVYMTRDRGVTTFSLFFQWWKRSSSAILLNIHTKSGQLTTVGLSACLLRHLQ